MKLRIQGNSLRLRVKRSELNQLAEGHSISETICFGPSPDARWQYELGSASQQAPVAVHPSPRGVSVVLSPERLSSWLLSDQTGIYADIAVSDAETLHVSLEKDFACLDRSDAANEDTFPNPLAGTVC